MAADMTVEAGQPLVVAYTFVDGAGAPLDLSGATVRFWARALDGSTAVGGPATIIGGSVGAVAYEGVAPVTSGELFCRFTATFPDRTVTQPLPGGIVVMVQDANPATPMYAGLTDLEVALGKPVPADQRGYAMYLLAAATVAIDEYCCRSFSGTVPESVRLACAGMAADTYGQGATVDGAGGAGPVVSETIGDYSVRYADPSTSLRSQSNSPSVYGFEYMLKRYRLCGATSVSTLSEKVTTGERFFDPWDAMEGEVPL